MSTKAGNDFLFEVMLTWTGESKALLSGIDAGGIITLAEYPGFESEGMAWSAEHLFLSAACTGFMTTLLARAKRYHLLLAGFSCRARGEMAIINGKYQFKRIDLFPTLFIKEALMNDRAVMVLEKTRENCLVINSISAAVHFHGKIIVAALIEQD